LTIGHPTLRQPHWPLKNPYWLVNEKVPKQDNRYKTETENSTPLNNGITTLPQRIFGLQLLNLTSTAATTHTNTHTHTHTSQIPLQLLLPLQSHLQTIQHRVKILYNALYTHCVYANTSCI